MRLPYFSTHAVVLVTIIMVQIVTGCLILYTRCGYSDHNNGAECKCQPSFSTQAVVIVTIMVQNLCGCLILVHILWL